MKAGASVGEHAIFGDTRHEVSARAAADSLLLRFPVSIISDLVAEHPQSLGPVVGDLVRRVNLLHARLAESDQGHCTRKQASSRVGTPDADPDRPAPDA